MRFEQAFHCFVVGITLALVSIVAPESRVSAAHAPPVHGDGERYMMGNANLATGRVDPTRINRATEISELAIDFDIPLEPSDVADAYDPFESVNRLVFGFNDVAYSYVLGPIADVYNLMPSLVRDVFDNFLSNLRAPVTLANDVLQGEFSRAGTTLVRFGMNSTIGFAGLVDIAQDYGFEKHDEDFGQTLAVWGVGEGIYLVLPLVGPSNPRDAIGQFVVDPFMDPLSVYLGSTGQYEWGYARATVAGVDGFAHVRKELQSIRRTAVDYYATVRSLYQQRRALEIANGEILNLPAIPDFDWNPDHTASSSVSTIASGEVPQIPRPLAVSHETSDGL